MSDARRRAKRLSDEDWRKKMVAEAVALQNRGNWNGAHIKYTELLEQTAHLLDKGELADMYDRRGLCCEKDGDVEQALDDYSEGISIIGPRSDLLFHRGRLYAQQLGRWSEAEDDLLAAASLSPGHAPTQKLLAQVQAETAVPPPLPGAQLAAESSLTTVVFKNPGPLGIALASEAMLDQMWLSVDADGDGLLGVEEVAAMLMMMGREDSAATIDRAMEELDADGSGEIDIAEFEQWYLVQPDRQQNLDPSVVIETADAAATRQGLEVGMRVVSIAGTEMRGASLQEVSKAIKQAVRPLTIEFEPPAEPVIATISADDDPVDFLKLRKQAGGSTATELKVGQLVEFGAI